MPNLGVALRLLQRVDAVERLALLALARDTLLLEDDSGRLALCGAALSESCPLVTGVVAGQARRPPMTAGGVETCPHSISSEVVEEEVVVEGATGLLALRTLRASLCSRVLRSAVHAFRTPSVDMMRTDYGF